MMEKIATSPYLNLLRNRIDITRVPFSDRGSRLLVFQIPDKSQLLLKLAERLTELQPDIDAYRHRPPFIRQLCLVDEEGQTVDFEVVTYPHALYFQARLGDFGLVFRDRHTLAFGLPPQVAAGLRFHVLPQFWEETERGGVFKAIRNLAYASNGEVFRNRIIPEEGGYMVEFGVQAGSDCAIHLTIGDSVVSQPGIYEYYNSLTGEPPPTAADTFGWTAAVLIDLTIQASQKEDVE